MTCVLCVLAFAGLRIDPAQASFYLEQARGDIKEAIRLQSAALLNCVFAQNCCLCTFRHIRCTIVTGGLLACRRRCQLGTLSSTLMLTCVRHCNAVQQVLSGLVMDTMSQ